MTSRTRSRLPLASALDLESPARAQRAGQHGPEPVVISDPVQHCRRDDHVDGLVETEVESVLMPHLGAISESIVGEPHHVGRRIEGQYATARHEREQRLSDAAGAAPDIEHGRVRGDVHEPFQDVRRPRLLRLARPVVRVGVPRSAHRGISVRRAAPAYPSRLPCCVGPAALWLSPELEVAGSSPAGSIGRRTVRRIP
jgi:hypothetical protein